MTWNPATDMTGTAVTLLLDENGRELGRYYASPRGFVPRTANGNGKPRPTEAAARAAVLELAIKGTLRQLEGLMRLQITTPPANQMFHAERGDVPQEISGVQHQPTQSQVC